MADYFWPLDDASAPFVETLHGANASLSLPGVWNGSTWDPAPSTAVIYRVAAPALSPYGVRLNYYANGQPWYAGAWSAPTISATLSGSGVYTGSGSFAHRQAFTIAFKMEWLGPFGTGVSYAPYAGVGTIFTHSQRRVLIGFNSNQGQDPFGLFFTRSGGATGYLQTVAFDMPTTLDYRAWDNWSGVYREPIKTPQWAQVVCRYDGSRKSIWVDGVKLAEDSTDDTFDVPEPGGLGGAGVLLNYNAMQAAYSELAVYHRALSDLEIGG